ncbi:MAG: hypothetical protein Q8M17_03145 [Actinomycetota bacterium]|nr:hypothetical protein [Actinomycetota bacterium]
MADRYGTVMVGRLKVSHEQFQEAGERWSRERHPAGYLRQDVMLCDDGVTFVMAVFFDTEESYKALADDPAQAEWYESVLMPMLDGEPQWFDGHWRAAMEG